MQRLIIEFIGESGSATEIRCYIARGHEVPQLKSRTTFDVSRLRAILDDSRHSTNEPLKHLALGRALRGWLDSVTSSNFSMLLTEVARSPYLLNQGVALVIDSFGEGMGETPLESLADGTSFLAARSVPLFTPFRHVRRAGANGVANLQELPHPHPQNRPLRLLFMASSPDNVSPPLDFEREEEVIRSATRAPEVELVVEDSGSMHGLNQRVLAAGRNWFDVVHLSGHAGISDGVHVFRAENEVGIAELVTPERIGSAFEGYWPRLIFLSGCDTAGQAPGTLPSLCEALVCAGAPTVLGWSQHVDDSTASIAAASLYRALSAGKPIDEAIANARIEMHNGECSDWHLLRCYGDLTPLSSLVTPPGTPDRVRVDRKEAAREFIDAGAKSEVCPAKDFVGRRRPLQRCLRALRTTKDLPIQTEGVLIFGQGELGKSSLAARLWDRMPKYNRCVCVGLLDEQALLSRLGDLFDDVLQEPDASRARSILLTTARSLYSRLNTLFKQYLRNTDVLFVFDDFEQNSCCSHEGPPEVDVHGDMLLTASSRSVLQDLLLAINKSNSRSRVIVTCRYRFLVSPPASLLIEQLDFVRGADWTKKLDMMSAFSAQCPLTLDVQERISTAAAGNFGLLKELYRRISAMHGSSADIMGAIDGAVEDFRQKLSLNGLLARVPAASAHTMACLALFNTPVPLAAVVSVAAKGDSEATIEAHLDRGIALGLVERLPQPKSQSSHYAVTDLLKTSLKRLLDEPTRVAATRRAFQFLQCEWSTDLEVSDV